MWKELDCRVVEELWWSVSCSSVALCLCVDRGHVAQAAVEAAHLEENVLLRAWRELAPCVSLQLLGQAESWIRKDKCRLFTNFKKSFRWIFLIMIWANRQNVLTCRASAGCRHVEAIVLLGSIDVRIPWDVDTTDCLLHPVGVAEMEAALKAALVF